MADIVTGTVTGMVDTSALVRDTADIRRETALEAGDIRRDVAKEAHDLSDEVRSSSYQLHRDLDSSATAAASDAVKYFIASTQAATQSAKEAATAAAFNEAKIESGFIKSAGDAALATQIMQGSIGLEAERTRGAMALQHGVLTLQIAQDGNATRALIQANEIASLRDKSAERYAKIVELEGDRRHSERSMQQNQWASFQNQLQALNSDIQTTKQGVVNFGSMAAGAGTQTTSNNVVR